MSAKTLKYLLSEQSASQSEHSNCSILPTPGATYILIIDSPPPMIPSIHQISQLLLSFVKKKNNNNNNSVLYKSFGFVTYYCFTPNGLFYWLTLSGALTLHIPTHSGRCPDLFYGKPLVKSCLCSKSQVARVRLKRCSPSRPTLRSYLGRLSQSPSLLIFAISLAFAAEKKNRQLGLRAREQI